MSSTPDSSSNDDELRRVGLCARCRHVRRVETARGSRFYRCGLAETDLRFTRYPGLPVLACPGYVAVAATTPE